MVESILRFIILPTHTGVLPPDRADTIVSKGLNSFAKLLMLSAVDPLTMLTFASFRASSLASRSGEAFELGRTRADTFSPGSLAMPTARWLPM